MKRAAFIGIVAGWFLVFASFVLAWIAARDGNWNGWALYCLVFLAGVFCVLSNMRTLHILEKLDE